MTQPVAQLLDFSGKAAIVTGGARGIGRAIACRLAEAGAAVMITDLDGEAATQTVQDIQAGGGKALATTADVSTLHDAKGVVAAAVEAFGRLDILVNNAGVYPPAPVMYLTEEVWDRVLNINLKGLFFYSQAAADEMIRAGRGGKIVNVASLEALHPTPALSAYDVSKGGVLMATKSLALELAAHNILVNAVAPGIIRTGGLEDLLSTLIPLNQTFEEKSELFKPRVALGRIGEPDDVAKVVLFLASAAADYITGEMIVIDGGYLLT